MNAQTPPKKRKPRDTYTALVYFHGMGEQRRYEEISRLVDALELYDANARAGSMEGLGIRFELEQARTALPQEVGYFRVPGKKNKKNGDAPHIRFYEAYYANLAAGGVDSIRVLLWLIKLGMRPFTILLTRWRDLPKLRRAILLGLWDSEQNKTIEKEGVGNVYREVLQSYSGFIEAPGSSEYGKGRAADYFKYVTKESSLKSDTIARRWRRRFLWVQLLILFLVITFALALYLIGYGLTAIATYQSPEWLPSLSFWGLAGIILFAGILFVRSFLRNYLGDVYFWTTYEETADKHRKRRAILDQCTNLLDHILADDNCTRLVLVGHSLGTTVSYETILELGRRARASGRSEAWEKLKRIECLITLASPVDKIHYLFETRVSKSHRYNTVIEELRGDREPTPFFEGEQPLIRWINFWDRADIVSSPLYTPRIRNRPGLDVENREVTSSIFPFPTYAHSNYVENEYVLHRIHSLLFEKNMDKQEAVEPAWEAAVRRLTITTALFQGALIALPWLGFLLLLCNWWNLPSPGILLTYALGVNIFFLLAGLALSLRERPRHTLVEPKLTETHLKMA